MSETAGKWRQLQQLTPYQWGVIMQAPFALWINWLRLRRGGYRAALENMPDRGKSALSGTQQLRLARETAFAVKIAVRAGPWRPRCLLRSLVLGWFLARRGIPFDLQLGVAAEAGDFNAHAWVEHAGVVLNDRADVADSFSAFQTGAGP